MTKIRIEIGGVAAAGKSTIALAVLSALRNLGLERGTTLSGDEAHPERDHVTQRLCLEALQRKSRDGELEIEIVTKNLAGEVHAGYLPAKDRMPEPVTVHRKHDSGTDMLARAIRAAAARSDGLMRGRVPSLCRHMRVVELIGLHGGLERTKIAACLWSNPWLRVSDVNFQYGGEVCALYQPLFEAGSDQAMRALAGRCSKEVAAIMMAPIIAELSEMEIGHRCGTVRPLTSRVHDTIQLDKAEFGKIDQWLQLSNVLASNHRVRSTLELPDFQVELMLLRMRHGIEAICKQNRITVSHDGRLGVLS